MQKQQYSILVVDDNPSDLYLLREAFSECRFKCQLAMASSPDEALQLLSQGSFDLLLSDFGADTDQGRNFISSVRARNRSLPIIVLSGNYNTAVAYESGANAFVRKPNDLQEFMEKVQSIMTFWVDVAELPFPKNLDHKIFFSKDQAA